MKRVIIKKLLVLVVLAIFGANPTVNAQCRNYSQNPSTEFYPKDDFGFIKDLTPEQKEKIKNLKLNHIKETIPIKNLIQEKKAHLATISYGDNPDIASINKTIDEIYDLKAELYKKRMAYHQEVRKLLNDEQKVIFDLHQQKNLDKNKKMGPKDRGNCCKGTGGMGEYGCGGYGHQYCCGMHNNKSCCSKHMQKQGCPSQGKTGCCGKK